MTVKKGDTFTLIGSGNGGWFVNHSTAPDAPKPTDPRLIVTVKVVKIEEAQ